MSFAAPANVAARLFPKLGEPLGLRLEAGRLAKDQVLLVQVRSMDRNRLLQLVIDTTGDVPMRYPTLFPDLRQALNRL